jgi:large subunit ribosomal protein L19
MNLLDVVKADHQNPSVNDQPNFKTGDTIIVHSRIKEGEKSRIQVFKGTVISIKKKGDLEGHFRVRKTSSGIGVERVYPFHSPNVEKIEVAQRGKSRRAKLYYLRDRSGKSARIAIDYDKKD